MKIDDNELQHQAMDAFIRGNPAEGSRIQNLFIEELKQAMRAGQDHCPCPADCSIHGKCFICVQTHRGHGNHLPYCMQGMVNKKLEALSELTEHTLIDRVKRPDYLEENYAGKTGENKDQNEE